MKEWICCEWHYLDHQKYCMYCGKIRPKQDDGLEDILRRLCVGYPSAYGYIEQEGEINTSFLKALREWRDKAIKKAAESHSCHVQEVTEARKQWGGVDQKRSAYHGLGKIYNEILSSCKCEECEKRRK